MAAAALAPELLVQLDPGRFRADNLLGAEDWGEARAWGGVWGVGEGREGHTGWGGGERSCGESGRGLWRAWFLETNYLGRGPVGVALWAGFTVEYLG